MAKRIVVQAEREGRQQERERRWRGHVRSWRASGVSQAEYCRQAKLAPADFSWWKHELQRRDGGKPHAAAPDSATFIPVKLEAAATECGCEVVLQNGRRLRIGSGVPAQWAAELAAALERSSPC